jgi:hypothetical protein
MTLFSLQIILYFDNSIVLMLKTFKSIKIITFSKIKLELEVNSILAKNLDNTGGNDKVFV